MAINKTELVKKIKAAVKPCLDAKGYKVKKSTRFVKIDGGTEQIVGLIITKSRDKTWRIQLGVRVRFPQIEKILNLGEDDPDEHGTYGGLIHLLMYSGFIEWTYTSDDDLSNINNEIVNHIESHAIPFLEKYKDTELVKQKLLSDDPKDWITYDRQGRTRVIAAILWHEGQHEESKQLLKEYIDRSQDQLPKYYMKAKTLLDHLDGL